MTSLDNGVDTPLTFTGTYTVNADGTCSMSLSLLQTDGTNVNLACALNSVGPQGATGLQLVVTNPGPTGGDNSTNYAVTLTAVKQ